MIDKKVKFSVVIPVYNEKKTVFKMIEELKNELAKLDADYEIITVNDMSFDGSREILEKIKGIKLINHSQNKGYGASLKTGIKNSSYDLILIIDADGTYSISAIPGIVRLALQYDLIIGSREKKGNVIPFERRYAKLFLNKFASYLSGKKIPDLNSGLRLFKKDIVFKYWELFPNKFSFTSTLTMVCAAHGYEMIFIPIDYYKREGKSSIKSIDFINFIKLVIRLSLFFNPFKVFAPIAVILVLSAIILSLLYFTGIISIFFDTLIIILFATALQTFFFGLLAEIIIRNKNSR